MLDQSARWDDATITAQPISHHQAFLSKYLTSDEIRHKDVLDLGCGPGGLIEPVLANRPRSVTGIDVSHKSIEICEERFPGANNLQFVRADAVSWDPGRQFDIIVSYSVLHLLGLDDDGKLALLRRLLRKGGVAVVDALPRTWYNLAVFTLAKNAPFKKSLFTLIGPMLNRTCPSRYYQDLAAAPLMSLKYKYWLDIPTLEARARKHGFRILASEHRKVGSAISPVKFRCKLILDE
jgi:trans-aconitate methyltransferase